MSAIEADQVTNKGQAHAEHVLSLILLFICLRIVSPINPWIYFLLVLTLCGFCVWISRALTKIDRNLGWSHAVILISCAATLLLQLTPLKSYGTLSLATISCLVIGGLGIIVFAWYCIQDPMPLDGRYFIYCLMPLMCWLYTQAP